MRVVVVVVPVVDEWAAEGGDVVDGDEDDTVIVRSAEGRGREGGEEKGGDTDSFLMTCLVFQCLATCVIKLRNYFI